jgi:hypothetical protein
LKHCFLDHIQVAFWAVQEAENEAAGPGDLLKHFFLDLAKVALSAAQKVENEVLGQATACNNAFSATTKSLSMPARS